ncbi:hypothetical protein P2N73_24140, partial [Escherichia coli]
VFIVAVLPAVAFTVRSRHRQIKRAVFHRPDNTVAVRPGQQVAVAVAGSRKGAPATPGSQ